MKPNEKLGIFYTNISLFFVPFTLSEHDALIDAVIFVKFSLCSSRNLSRARRTGFRSNDRSVSISLDNGTTLQGLLTAPSLRRFEKTYSHGEISDCRSPYPPINNVKHASIRRHWALTPRSLREASLFCFSFFFGRVSRYCSRSFFVAFSHPVSFLP